MYYEKDIKETNMRKRIIVMIFAILAVAIFAISCGKHKHSYTEEVVPPTCTERGYTRYTCECGDEYLDNFADPAHTFTEEVVAPTCGDKGYTNLKCSVCGYTEKKEGSEVAATGNHTWEWVVGREATCTKEGISRQQCTVCKQFNGQVSQKIAKKNHEFEEKIVKEPTCTESGTKAEVCKICGTQNGNGVTIEALGHVWDDGVEVPPTCTEKGCTLYTCSRCKETKQENVVDELGHDFVTTVIEPTCTEDGYTEYRCSRCDLKENKDLQKALGHSIDETTPYEKEDPTCIKDGYKIFACTRCCKDSLVGEEGTKGDGVSAWYKEVIPATGEHVFDVVKGTVNESCERPKYTIYGCSKDPDCTATYEVDVEGSAARGHDISHDEAHYVEAESLAPSCKERGYKLYRCSRCDYTEKDYEDIVPHTKQEGDLGNTVAPTCITNGYTEYTCSVCGQTFRPEDEITPATGVHGGWIVTDEVVAPTCSEEGYTVYRCGYDQNCTETTHKDFTERTAHSFVDEGSGTISCTICGHEYSDIMYEKVTIPGGDITGDPTLGESGITVDISGEKPGTPITLTGTTPLEIAIPEGKSADEGIVRITTDDDTVNYTVEIQVDGNWTEVKSGLSGSDIFVDLYKYTNITAIRVTADAAANATITIYA